MKAWSNSDTTNNSGFVPEKRLLVAVLQRAVTDYVTGDMEMKKEALEWIMDETFECEERPLTFRYICEALEFDIAGLRKAILLHAENENAAGLLKEAV